MSQMAQRRVDAGVMYDAIAPIVVSMRDRMRSVPGAFSDDDQFTDAVVAWADDLSNMLVGVEVAVTALEDLARTSPFFPAFADVMVKVAGPEWATEKLLFDVPVVLEEEVVDLSTGRTVERYPCVVPGVVTMTRMELRRSGPPDYERELARLVKERPGIATSRKPNVWGSASSEADAAGAQVQPRGDLQDQINRLRGGVGDA